MLTKALCASDVREPVAHARSHIILKQEALVQAQLLAGHNAILMTKQRWPPVPPFYVIA